MRYPKLALLTLIVAAATGLSLSMAEREKTIQPPAPSQVHQREIIVEYDTARAGKSVSAFCAEKGVSFVRDLPLSYTTYRIVRVPEEQDYNQALANLAADPRVKSVGPNVIKRVSETVLDDPLLLNGATDSAEGLTDPYVKNNQHALLLTGCLEAWDTTTGSSGIVVAMSDTGANLTHEDLVNRLWVNTDEIPDNDVDDDANGYVDDVHGYDFADEDDDGIEGPDKDPTDPSSSDVSHGTATASIVAGQGNNGLGIAGVAGGSSEGNGVRLMILRVGPNTNIAVAAEIAALDYAVANGAKVISMSFGGETGGQVEEDAINRAWDAGLYVVAAAGNNSQGNPLGVDLPAGFDKCVAVGATSIFSSQSVIGSTSIIAETITDYSKTGPELEIVAPGTHIMAAANVPAEYTDSVLRQFTGTSAATPLVAGLAALLLSADPMLTNTNIRNYINSSALELGDAGRDESYGYGRIRMDMAMDLVTGDVEPGDADGNMQVDEADLTVIVALDGVTSADANYNAGADYNRDNVINNQDVLAVVLAIAGPADGDTDADGDVDEDDILPIANLFGSAAGDTEYSAAADADRNGVIDELDLFAVGRNFGN